MNEDIKIPTFIKTDQNQTEQETVHTLGDGIIHHEQKPDSGAILYGQRLFDHEGSPKESSY